MHPECLSWILDAHCNQPAKIAAVLNVKLHFTFSTRGVDLYAATE